MMIEHDVFLSLSSPLYIIFHNFHSILILTIIKSGENHDYVANTYSNIAGIYETKAQPSIAHDFYDKALHIRSTLHGTSDYDGTYGDYDGTY